MESRGEAYGLNGFPIASNFSRLAITQSGSPKSLLSGSRLMCCGGRVSTPGPLKQSGPNYHFATVLVFYLLNLWRLAQGEHKAAGPSVPPFWQPEANGTADRSAERKGKAPDRKRGRVPRRPSDDSDDDNNGQESRFGSGIRSQAPAYRLACPYFKRSPQLYLNCQSCRGPGWRTVHHVKGHLYRRHRREPQCRRCYLIFDSEASLREHEMSIQKCAPQEGIAADGFDQEQEKLLRSRKRKSTRSSEAEKWREMYQILFPNDDPAAMPSPYYDEHYPEIGAPPPDNSDPVAAFSRYCEEELPRMVQRQLDLLSHSSPLPITDELKANFITIVRNCQAELLPAFRQNNMEISHGPLPQGTTPLLLAENLAIGLSPFDGIPGQAGSSQQRMPATVNIPMLDDEPALGFSDASKSSSSESLATLTTGEWGNLDELDAWQMDKSLPLYRGVNVADVELPDFLTFDAQQTMGSVAGTSEEEEFAGFENSDLQAGLFML